MEIAGNSARFEPLVTPGLLPGPYVTSHQRKFWSRTVINAEKSALASAACGCLFAALTFAIPKLSVLPSSPAIGAAQLAALALLMPGLTCAFAYATRGSVHAFHLWIAALGNFVFYFALCWIAVRLVRVFRQRKPRQGRR
jgi:hypothetical protein